MTIIIDLVKENDPHWLSTEGKMKGRREEIMARHRENWLQRQELPEGLASFKDFSKTGSNKYKTK